MIEPDAALARVLEAAHPPRTIRLPLAEAAGAVLAGPVRCDRDFPHFDRAMMDGVAVRLADAGKRVVVAGEARAGEASASTVEPGRCVDIMTGAPCPPGTEAVVREEDLGRDGDGVLLPAAIETEAHIDRRGSECREGEVVLREGDFLTPIAIGLLASVGCESLPVFDPPDVAVIVTGHEIVATEAVPGAAAIRDSNGPMLAALAGSAGVRSVTRLRADDSEESLASALDAACDRRIVFLTGGVSAGRYDLVPGQVERSGAEIVFHKVRHKPAKPMLFARKGEQLIFGLPGNPLAAHFAFHRYGAPAIRRLAGLPEGTVSRTGILTRPVRSASGWTRFLLSHADLRDGEWRVTPCATASRADLFSTTRANCYIRLPFGAVARAEGESVNFEPVVGFDPAAFLT